MDKSLAIILLLGMVFALSIIGLIGGFALGIAQIVTVSAWIAGSIFSLAIVAFLVISVGTAFCDSRK